MGGKAKSVGLAQKTVDKIEAAAKEIGYERNYWAGALARQSTDIVTILLGILSGEWENQIIYSVTQSLTNKDYFPFLAVDWREPALFEKMVTAAIQRRDAGIICHSATGNAEQYMRIFKNGIPLVFLGDIPDILQGIPGINSVVWDDEQAVKTAINHLIDTGRKKIAFIGADHGVDSDHRRLAAYEQALDEAGLEVRKDWQIWLGLAPMSFLGTQEALEQLFAPEVAHPDALFALNHAIAHDVLRVASEMGIRIPEDTALIGLGDLSANKASGISTMREPLQELGEAAAQMLIKLIEDPNQNPLHRKISCNELLIRKTTAVYPLISPPSEASISRNTFHANPLSATRSNNPTPSHSLSSTKTSPD